MDMEYSKYFVMFMSHVCHTKNGYKYIRDMTRREVEWELIHGHWRVLTKGLTNALRWRLSLPDEEWDRILLVWKLGGGE